MSCKCKNCQKHSDSGFKTSAQLKKTYAPFNPANAARKKPVKNTPKVVSSTSDPVSKEWEREILRRKPPQAPVLDIHESDSRYEKLHGIYREVLKMYKAGMSRRKRAGVHPHLPIKHGHPYNKILRHFNHLKAEKNPSFWEQHKDTHPWSILRSHEFNKFSEGGVLKDQVIFRAGKHRPGTPEYTLKDLHDIKKNFDKYCKGKNPIMEVPMASAKMMPGVPAVLGHEEEQDILNRSDLPAAGWVSDLRVNPKDKTLIADFVGVPRQLYKAIKDGRYKYKSAEIYDKNPYDDKDTKSLRRVSWLGADVPQIKGLGALTAPEMHEQFASYTSIPMKCVAVKQTVPGCYSCFFERQGETMSREELLKKLQEMGVDCSSISDAVPDEVLAEWVRSIDDKKHETDMDDEYSKEEGSEPEEDYDEMYGEDPDLEETSAEEDKGDRDTEIDKPLSKRKMKEKCYSERQKKIEARFARIEKLAEKQEKVARKAARNATFNLIDSEVVGLIRDGRITPAQKDTVTDILRSLPNSVTRKYSEVVNGKKVVSELTPLEKAIRDYKNGPKVSHFGERFTAPTGSVTEDRKKWSEETYEKFHDVMAKCGVSRETFIETNLKADEHQWNDTKNKWAIR
jgi:hypothetical protein